jgi:hypothetical protein
MMKRIIPAAVFLFLAVGIFAGGRKQTYEAFDAGDYRMDETGTFFQTIGWTEGGAGRYAIEVEQENSPGYWTTIQTFETEETSAELSLPAGDYRFRISTYNVLGKIAAVSDWMPFKIRPAKQPAAEKLSPAAIPWLLPTPADASRIFPGLRRTLST